MATREPARWGLAAVAAARRARLLAAPGTLGLVPSARALALLRGRDYVLPLDIADLAVDVLAHRLVLSFDALAEGGDPRVVRQVLEQVDPPQVAPDEQLARAA